MNASKSNDRGRPRLLLFVGAAIALVAAVLWLLLPSDVETESLGGVERVHDRHAQGSADAPLDPVDGRQTVRNGARVESAETQALPSVDPAHSIEVILHFDDVLPTDTVHHVVVDGVPFVPSTHKWQSKRNRHRYDAEDVLYSGEGECLARLNWGAGGAARIARPKEASLLLVQVESDFVLEAKAAEFDPASPIDAIHVKCEVGGLVQLRAVGDVPLTQAELAEINGLEVQLASSDWEDAMQVFGVFEDSGICTMRGISPGRYSDGSDFLFRVQKVNSTNHPDGSMHSPFRLVPGLTFAAVPGQRLVIDVPVTRGRRLYGRVMDGGPVKGAHVKVRMSEGGDDSIEETTETGDDGTFDFQGLAHEITRFEASTGDSEFIVQALPGESLGFPEDEPLIVNLGTSATIEYVVTTPDGSPVEGARIDLDFEAPASAKATVGSLTGSSGRAVVRDVQFIPHVATVIGSFGPGRSVFRNSHHGRGKSPADAVEPEWYASASVVPPLGVERTRVALELKELPEVTLSLLGLEIEENDRVSLRIGTGASRRRDDELGDVVRGETCGTMRWDPSSASFRGRLAPGSYMASAHIRRTFGELELDLESHPKHFVVPESGEPLTIPIQALQTRAVTGTLLDEIGRPIPGAKLNLRSLSYSPGCYRNATTDERGAFRFEMVVPGDYQLLASSKTHAFDSKQVVEVPTGRDDWHLDVEAAGCGAVEVHIDFRGTPHDGDVRITTTHLATDMTVSKEIRLDRPVVSVMLDGIPKGQNTLALFSRENREADYPGEYPEPIGVYWSTTVQVVPGETVQAQLVVDPEQSQLIQGRVTSSAPIQWRASIEAMQGHQRCGGENVDEIGRFELWVPTLEGLELDLTTWEGQRLFRAPLSELIGPDGRVALEIAPGRIRGRLAPGALEAAGWRAKFAAARRGSTFVCESKYWDDEWFDMIGLAPGTYDVYVKRHGSDEPDPRFESQTIVVTDSPALVEVTLDLK